MFEPNLLSHKERLKTLKILKKNGLQTYGFVSPIIPELVEIKKVIQESKNFVDYFWFEILNLKASGQNFTNLLKARFPKSYNIMKDKEKFQSFLKRLKQIIKEEKIKTEGVVIHYPKFRIERIR